MNPALSVVIFTTLAGTAQGLVLALFATEWSSGRHWLSSSPEAGFYVLGAAVAALLGAGGLVSSFFHLGRPERAWRAATMWRTSWLSREVIALPAFIALTAAYALAHALQSEWGFIAGALAALAAVGLFVCTGMVYACMPFLREWATPLTPINFALLGSASGFTLAAALAADGAPGVQRFLLIGALVFTLLGLIGRLAAWQRNANLAPKSTLQTAIGIKHSRIRQIAQGFMGGSFNTREFFHGRSPSTLSALRAITLVAGFAVPALALAADLALPQILPFALAVAVLVQHLGLLAERWLFFAEARHPQNLYYQRMA